MTNAEAIEMATATQAEIERRITVGAIPPRPEGAEFGAWFHAHVGCQRCRYGVRMLGVVVSGAPVCGNCIENRSVSAVIEVREDVFVPISYSGPLPTPDAPKKGRKAREIE